MKNYIHELNSFRDWTLINRPTTGEIALWYSLLAINNMVSWKDQFTVANQTLQLMTGLSKSSLDRARNKLVQRGLIQYKTGTTRQAGSYRLISLWDQCGSNRGTNVGLKPDQCGSNRGNINKLNKTKQTNNPPISPPTTEVDKLVPESDNNRRIVFSSYEQEFGRPLSPIEAEQLKFWFENHPEELILHALRTAVLSQNRSMKYIQAILGNWKKAGARCMQDVEELERKFQEKKTRTAPGSKTSISPEEEREIYIPQKVGLN